jgi:hypothetical protein
LLNSSFEDFLIELLIVDVGEILILVFREIPIGALFDAFGNTADDLFEAGRVVVVAENCLEKTSP